MAQNITIQGATYSAVPSVLLPKQGGGTASFVDVTDTTAAASDVASGKYFYTAAGVKTAGTNSGGGGFEPIYTKSIGHIESTSTSETDTGQTASVTVAGRYGLFIVVAECGTSVNGRHLATVSLFASTSSSTTTLGNTVNYYIDSSGNIVGTPYNSTSQQGVYAKVSSASTTVINLKFYTRYNNTRTKTINGDYTVRIYQFKQSDIIGM